MGCLGVVGLLGVAYAAMDIPEVDPAIGEQSTVVRYADGSEIGRIGSVNRREVSLTRVPDHVQKAVLAAENRTFYSDSGISPVAIARAFVNNLRGGPTQGGSTITQQYVKYTRLSSEQTYTRKLKEAIISIKIDRQLSKDQILQEYLNAIYFGRGAYGIQAAADTYFDKDVSELTPEEGALLASLVKSPSTYDPIESRDAVEPRWHYVLDGMVELGAISPAEADAAKFPTVQPPEQDTRYTSPERHLLETVRKELISDEVGLPEDRINREGMDVTTTFSRQSVRNANKAVARTWKTMKAEGTAPPKDLFVGMSAVQPGTGKVKAIFGGRDFATRQYNDATQSTSQPGSTFKPFTLLAGLEQGIGLRSRFNGDSPREFPEYSKPVNNFGQEDYGMTNLIDATESSVNTVYVALGLAIAEEYEEEQGDENGFRRIAEVVHEAGVPEDVDVAADPSLPLGTSSVTTLDLAGAYSTLANEGVHAEPYIVEKVSTGEGGVLYEHEREADRRFDADVIADVTYALEKVVEDGSGEAAQALGRPAAGKTGTSQDNRSAWYAGYTPQLAATVAFFRDDEGRKRPLRGIGRFPDGVGMTGGSYPAELWTAFMQGALKGKEVQSFDEPEFVGDTLNPKPTPTPTPTLTDTPTPTLTPTPTPTGPPTPTLPPTPTGPPTPTSSPTFPPPDPEPSETETGWPFPEESRGAGNGPRAGPGSPEPRPG